MRTVDLSDPNLDLTELCLREYPNVVITSIKYDASFPKNSIFAYDYFFELNGENIQQSCSVSGRVWKDNDFHQHDIIYKSDFVEV